MESQTTPALLFQNLLPGVRLQRVRDQILAQFSFVAVCAFERAAIRDHHLEYLHVQWKPARGDLFVARCDFHWVCQLQPIADFLKAYTVEAMLCCPVGMYDMACFAKPSATQPDSLSATTSDSLAKPTSNGSVLQTSDSLSATTSPEQMEITHADPGVNHLGLFVPRGQESVVVAPEPKEPVPDDALIKSCIQLSSPVIVTERRDYKHDQLTLLSCVRPLTKCVPLHYRIRKDEHGRVYYASWAAQASNSSDPTSVCFTPDEVTQILQQYDLIVNSFYKHDPATRIRPRWGRGDNVEVFWEAAARVLRPSRRVVIEVNG
jgi:hypothetical protein